MTATILGFANAISEVDNYGSAPTSGTGSQKSPYVAEYTKVATTANYVDVNFTATDECWISWHSQYDSGWNSGSKEVLVLYGTDGTALFRIYTTAAYTASIQYWDGSTWQNSITPWSIVGNGQVKWDVHVKIANSGGKLELYANKILYATYTGDTLQTAVTQINKLRLLNPGTTTYLSAIFITDTVSVNMEFLQALINSDGTHTDWTGSYTAIDEAGESTADAIASTAENDVSSFGFGALDTEFNASYDVSAVCVSAKAESVVATTGSIQTMVRSGSTDGFSSDHALVDSYGVVKDIFATNPDTASPWTFSEADAAEVGVKAIS